MKYTIENNEAELWDNNEAYITLLPIVEFIMDGKSVVVDRKNKRTVKVTLPAEVVDTQDEEKAKEIIIEKLKQEGYTEILIQGKWGIAL